MSHTVKVQTQIKDLQLVRNAVKELNKIFGEEEYRVIETGNVSVRFYQGKKAVKNGIVLKIKGWEYPILIDLDTGEIYYDNYNGKWGNSKKLNQFKQAYAVQMALKIAEKQGVKKSILEKLKEQAKDQMKKGEPIKLKIPVK